MSTAESTTQPKRLQCRHIFPEGRRCGSPCLRGEAFCYFHHTTRKPVPQLSRRRARQGAFTLPMPEDRAAIQLSIGEILARVAANQLDSRRAGLLLYGLQIALQSLPRPVASTAASTPSTRGRRHTQAQLQPKPQPHVEEIVLHPTHGPVAPEAEFQKDPAHKTLEDILMEQWAKDADNDEARQQDTHPITLPHLQASVAAPSPSPSSDLPPAQPDQKPVSRSNPNLRPCKTLHRNVQGGQGTPTFLHPRPAHSSTTPPRLKFLRDGTERSSRETTWSSVEPLEKRLAGVVRRKV